MPRRFTDLIIWQEGRALVAEVYQISATGAFGADRGLRDQVRQAAVSIPSNIAEGFERGGRREFRPALTVAKGSCGELHTQLCIAFDVGHISADLLKSLLERTERLGRRIAVMRNAVSAQRDQRRTL
jgi:four helix bundle protein